MAPKSDKTELSSIQTGLVELLALTHQLQEIHFLEQHRPEHLLQDEDLCSVPSSIVVISDVRLLSVRRSETDEFSFTFVYV